MGNIRLFFVDASHFVTGGFLSRCWCKTRKWVRTGSGRNRFNVLGALDFVRKSVTCISNTTYITSEQVIALLKKIAADSAAPAVVILDNARYQACNAVREAAAKLGIGLVFLPTYSPNLNLIERVWKHVKSDVLHLAYHETFAAFCDSISNCIDSLHIAAFEKMQSLTSRNFKIVEPQNVIQLRI